jgi:hypothetical protein
MPCNWRPHQVIDPTTGRYFTEPSAWGLIGDLFEKPLPIEEVVLRDPPGRTGYVVKVALQVGLPDLYVKVQLGSGYVIGRSFHYSVYGEST